MDMNRPSSYSAFGDKRELYLATLDRYVARSRADMLQALAAEATLAKALQRVFDRALVYLAAYLVPNGDTIVPLFLSDTESRIPPNFSIDPVAKTDRLRREAFREALYHDCSDDDLALARASTSS
jgi:AcrR family transcriptional regulator